MARNDSPAEALLKDVMAQALSPPLKAAGFRKSGMSYHRRRGEAVQVVNVQVSHGSTWSEKSFYVNVGIAFDAICRMMDLPILERPKEYECHDRGTGGRLETLIADCPDRWSIQVGADLGGLTKHLRVSVEHLAGELGRIDGIETYRQHGWFDRFRPTRSNAQILYLLGDREAAWVEVQGLVRLFSDRQNAPGPRRFVEQLRLDDLKSHLD